MTHSKGENVESSTERAEAVHEEMMQGAVNDECAGGVASPGLFATDEINDDVAGCEQSKARGRYIDTVESTVSEHARDQ